MILPFDSVNAEDKTVRRVVPTKQKNSGFKPGVDSKATHVLIWCPNCKQHGTLEFVGITQEALRKMDRAEDGKTIRARCYGCAPGGIVRDVVALKDAPDEMLNNIQKTMKRYQEMGLRVPDNLLPPEKVLSMGLAPPWVLARIRDYISREKNGQ